MRIQVKARAKPDTYGGYRFWLRKGQSLSYTTSDTDIMALVALDQRRVYFRPIVDISSPTVSIHADAFRDGVETMTWANSISRVIGSSWT